MKIFFRLLGFSLFFTPLLIAGVIFLFLQQQPLVTSVASLSHADIARAKTIIKRNDPRRLLEGQQKSVTISDKDLSLALNHLFSRVIKGSVETKLSSQTVNIHGTSILPDNPIGKYLNVKLTLAEDQQQLAVKKLSIGSADIPGFIIQDLISFYAEGKQGSQIAAITNMLQSVQVTRNKIHLSYVWQSNALKQFKDIVFNEQDQATLLAYQNHLAKITNNLSRNRKHSFTVLLEPMFRYAAKRSGNNDPIEENRALFIVLAAYVNGHSLKGITDSTRTKTRHLKLYLQNRSDFVQHFSVSAGLTVTAGNTLADAIGLFKEHEDKKGSSGFSFTDIAADRAGVRLAKLATDSNAGAKRIQKLMSTRLTELIFMPKSNDLPENITTATFRSKYQNGRGHNYQKIMYLLCIKVENISFIRKYSFNQLTK